MANRKTEKAPLNGVKAAESDEKAPLGTPGDGAGDSPTEPVDPSMSEDLQDATVADVMVDPEPERPGEDADTALADPDGAARDAQTDAQPDTAGGASDAQDGAPGPEAETGSGAGADDPETDITVTGTDTPEDAPPDTARDMAAKAPPAPDAGAAPIAPAVAPAPAPRGPGFVPMLLGGGLAAAIGWGVATFTAPPPPPSVAPARVDTLEEELRSVAGSIAELEIPAEVDLTPLETAQADLVGRLDDLAIRIEALEIAAGGAAGAEVLEGLRAEMGAIAGALETALAETTPRIEALEAKAADLGNAEAEAREVARRTAKNQVAAALRDGLPYAEAAAMLDDMPDVLAANADAGLPSRGQLGEGFDALARDALAAARDAGAAEGGIGGLASSLLNIRSTEPREGDDPDSVLSRVEAAVRAGDLETALTEIDALPPEAAAVLSDWSARARTRLEAEAALQDYLEG